MTLTVSVFVSICQTLSVQVVDSDLWGTTALEEIGRRSSDQDWQVNIGGGGALLVERFDFNQWRGVKESWDSSME